MQKSIFFSKEYSDIDLKKMNDLKFIPNMNSTSELLIENKAFAADSEEEFTMSEDDASAASEAEAASEEEDGSVDEPTSEDEAASVESEHEESEAHQTC